MASLVRSYFSSPIPLWPNTTQSYTNQSMNSANTRIATVFCAPEAATITDLGLRVASRTGTPPTYRISLQGVDGSGNPDGSILASNTFTPPADSTWNNTFQWVTLSSSYAVTAGALYAWVVDYSSGTVDGSNFSSFTRFEGGIASGRPQLPYNLNDTTGSSWTKSSVAFQCIYGFKSSSAVYGVPWASFLTTATGGSGQRVARKFTLPSGMATSYTVVGLRLMLTTPSGGTTYGVGLWDSSGAQVNTTLTLDSDAVGSVAGGQRAIEVYFASPATLSPGTTYYAGIERTGSANPSLNGIGLSAANDALAYGLGTDSYQSAWNGSTWTDATTSIPLVELLLGDITSSGGTSPVGQITGARSIGTY